MSSNTLTTPITSFRSKKYFFLSNFAPSPVYYNGILCPTVEHAFQAAKSLDRDEQSRCALEKTPQTAKHFGRRVALRPDWEEVKESIMEDLLRQKFTNPELRQKLLDTGDAELIEGNTWGDRYWGVCGGKGKNRLGYLLMKIRSELQNISKGETTMVSNTPSFTFSTIHTPEEIVDLMFENTRDGVLYVPGFPYDEGDESDCVYKCQMHWNEQLREIIKVEIGNGLSSEGGLAYLPDRPFSCDIATRHSRYVKLVASQAPRAVVNNEAQLLAAALVLNRFADHVERIG